MNELTPRERFQAIMNFKAFDRLPLVEWAVWWDKTIDRWHGEGLPVHLTDRYDICRHFGLEPYLQDWFSTRSQDFPRAAKHSDGVVASMEDYEKVHSRLYLLPAVDHARWTRWAEQQELGEVVLWFSVEGFFWFPRELLGVERHLYTFYDHPELMHRINTDLAEWILSVIDEICSICKPDFMTFAEDMSYNHGPMLSKELFEEFLKPYYDRVTRRLDECGIIPIVDSDGDVSEAATWFEKAGIKGILPLERQAGVDVGKIREAHPKMRFIGCFDKMTMNQGEQAMRAEFERLLPTASQGGLIVSCDHQTPPGVSYQDYQLYLRLFAEYAERAGQTASSLS